MFSRNGYRCRLVLTLILFVVSLYFASVIMFTSSDLQASSLASYGCAPKRPTGCSEAILTLNQVDNRQLSQQSNCSLTEYTQKYLSNSASTLFVYRQPQVESCRFADEIFSNFKKSNHSSSIQHFYWRKSFLIYLKLEKAVYVQFEEVIDIFQQKRRNVREDTSKVAEWKQSLGVDWWLEGAPTVRSARLLAWSHPGRGRYSWKAPGLVLSRRCSQPDHWLLVGGLRRFAHVPSSAEGAASACTKFHGFSSWCDPDSLRSLDFAIPPCLLIGIRPVPKARKTDNTVLMSDQGKLYSMFGFVPGEEQRHPYRLDSFGVLKFHPVKKSGY